MQSSGWDAPGAATDLPAEYVTWLDAVCAAAGCVFVPLDLLLEPYDGPSDRTPVWADRYFQWV
ncbi:hypothetical protein [Streptomyces werraensis]|uniref:hypothetical protein n=1 Tax=Streptomyces werraensis TaxID=68284 RepID=UPI0037CD0863